MSNYSEINFSFKISNIGYSYNLKKQATNSRSPAFAGVRKSRSGTPAFDQKL